MLLGVSAGLPQGGLWWHQLQYKALGCPAQKLCFPKWFCAAERSREPLHGIGKSAGVSPTKLMCSVHLRRAFEKCGNLLSCSAFSVFVKPCKVREAEELLNYLVHWADVLWSLTCIYNMLEVHQRCTASAVFKREYCTSSVPRHHEVCRWKQETVILFVHHQRNFVVSWRGPVVTSRAEVRPVVSSYNITHVLSHLSWWLFSENPPHFRGQVEDQCSRALCVVI